MHALIAFDKFKDALTAEEACAAAKAGILGIHPDWTVECLPISDGGEGFAISLTQALGGEIRTTPVTGPRGDTLKARWGILNLDTLPDAIRREDNLPAYGKLALLDMAEASGLQPLPEDARNPWETTTLGTGELIAHAFKAGAQTIILGVGGSATNDLGIGALQALGLKLLDDQRRPLIPATPRQWERVVRLSEGVWPGLPDIRIACDVTNPLLGPNGATHTFGPQKGLQSDQVNVLEKAVGRMAKMLCAFFEKPRTLMMEQGTGAAGGLPFGLMVACDATLTSGASLFHRWLDLDERIKQADLVISGEGRIDQGTLQGKGPGALAARASALGKPVYLFGGAVDSCIREMGDKLTTCAITPTDMPLPEALAQSAALLEQAISNHFRNSPPQSGVSETTLA
jgi:glycerate kinase